MTAPRPGLSAFVMSAMMSSSLACARSAEQVWLDNVGDPCRSDYSFCVDSLNVQRCEDDVWTLTPCDVVCSEIGMAYVAQGCDETCICTLMDPTGCTPGETACASDDVVSVCDEAQLWSDFDCETVCADAGLASVGCVAETEDVAASCWCTSEGTPCDASEAPLCVDEAVLAVCVNDVWVFRSCDDVCGGSGMCVPWSNPHECACQSE